MEKTVMDKEQWIDRVMNSVADIGRAEGNPFLYQKVLSKLSQRHEGTVSPRVVWLAGCLLVLMAVVNFSVVPKSNVAVSKRGMEALASEYGLTADDTYISIIDNMSGHE